VWNKSDIVDTRRDKAHETRGGCCVEGDDGGEVVVEYECESARHKW